MKDLLGIMISALVIAIPALAIFGLAKMGLSLFVALARIGAVIFAIYLILKISCSYMGINI